MDTLTTPLPTPVVPVEPPADGQLGGPRPTRRRFRRRRLWLVLGVVAAILLLLGGTAAFLATRLLPIWHEADAGRHHLLAGAALIQSAGPSLTSKQADAASADFNAAYQEFSAAHARLTKSRVVATLAHLPFIGDQMAAARGLTSMGIHLARAGEQAAIDFKTLTAPPAAGSAALTPGEKVMKAFGYVDQIAAMLDQVKTDRATIPRSGLLPQLRQAVAQFDDKFAKVERGLVAFRQAQPAVADLIGANGPRTYMVLQQDSAEQRATGGFIGSVGFLTFDRGKLAPFEPIDVYKIDNASTAHFDPPAPLKSVFHLKTWSLRDANWSPDFPTSARQAEAMLTAETGRRVDGVIAIDPYLVSRLLGVLGPTPIPETGDVVDQNNFFEKTLLAVQLYSGQGNRKAFLSYAARAIFGRVSSAPSSSWAGLVNSLQWGCESRSLQAYLHDPRSQQLVTRYGCSGEIRKPADDGLFIVTANVGGNKDDYWLRRSYSLSIAVNADGTARHTLHIKYGGLTPQDKPGSNFKPLTGKWGYTGWLRVYLPPSSIIRGISGAALQPGDDSGRQVLQGWLYVQFNTDVDVVVVYDVPLKVRPGAQKLELLWQKQAGRQGDPINLDIKWPADWSLQSARLNGQATKTPVTSDLSVDRDLVFTFVRP